MVQYVRPSQMELELEKMQSESADERTSFNHDIAKMEAIGGLK